MEDSDTSSILDAVLYDATLYVVLGALVLVGILIALKGWRLRATRKGRRRRSHRHL